MLTVLAVLFVLIPYLITTVYHRLLFTLITRLSQYPALLEHATLSNVHSFIVCTAHLKQDTFLAQPLTQSIDVPPDFPPISIQHTLAKITSILLWLIPQCWLVMRELVWSDAYVSKLQPTLHGVFAESRPWHGEGFK